MSPRPANFVFLVETEFLHVGRAGVELLNLGDAPALASQSAGSIGVSHCTQPNSEHILKVAPTGFVDRLEVGHEIQRVVT